MNNRVAIIYDFDGTLIDGEMVDNLICDLGYQSPSIFWDQSNESATKHSADRVCNYMLALIELAKKKKLSLTLKTLQEYGAKLTVRNGLDCSDTGWFNTVNSEYKKHGLEVFHYVVTSGLVEIVESCCIASAFTKIYGSRFLYDEKTNEAKWPAHIVNYTTKTQFLFRISKGVLDQNDDAKLNERTSHNDMNIPFANMIFIGDGYTDIPCFSLIKKYGGYSVAVLKDPIAKSSLQQMENLVADNRVDYISLTKHFEEDGKLLENMSQIAMQITNRSNK